MWKISGFSVDAKTTFHFTFCKIFSEYKSLQKKLTHEFKNPLDLNTSSQKSLSSQKRICEK